jgi:tetratricopeptide (TPR) repeat protein
VKKQPPTGETALSVAEPSPGSLALWLGIILVITAWMYAPGRHHEFVNYDDPDYVTANSHVTTGLTWENVRWAFVTGHASNWHPLTWLTHQLDCTWFGTDPGPPHLVSLAYHLLNTVLLFFVLRNFTGAASRSLVVAGLFALHPLHVESVAWISERKDVLSACFFFLTLLGYQQYTRAMEPQNGQPRRGRSVAWFLASLVAFMLGLMSKPMLVTVPFLLLLLDFWPLQRLNFNGPDWKLRLPRLVLEKLPFLVLSLASCVATFMVQREGGAVSVSLSLGARLANAVVACVRYLGKMLCPIDLSVLYPHPGHWPVWAVTLCALVVFGITAAAVWTGRKRPYFLAGWFWFLGMLVPVVGIIQVGIQSMADRYTYLPMIGLFVALVWGVADLLALHESKPRAAWALPIVTLLLCAWLGREQVGIWRNSETLFRRAVQATSGNYLAHNNLGFYYSEKGRISDAMVEYQKSLDINSQYPDALNNMGHTLAALRRHAEALPLYEAALRLQPHQVEVRNNYGNSLSDLGRIDEAIEQYHQVLEKAPLHADANNNLGIALAMKGQLQEAMAHFRTAITNKQNYAGAHSNLGNALAALHQLDEAVAQYQICLQLNPKDAQAHNNLANVLVEQGRAAEAVGHYEEAIRLRADNPEAHYNLGLSLRRLNRPQEARRHLEEALRLRPDYAEAKKALAQ